MKKRFFNSFLLCILLSLCLLALSSCAKHDEDASVTETPTPTELATEGEHQHQYASECDLVCDDCGEKRYNASNHIYTSDSKCQDITCTLCGYVRKQSHLYLVYESVDASTQHGGYKKERCNKCNDEIYTELDIITPETYGLPVVYIRNLGSNDLDVAKLTKSNGEITVKYEYLSNSDSIKSFECYATVKVQGASSSSYQKKNYTVKLFDDDSLESRFKVNLGWGKESKYCLKANYVDSSHARNIVGAKLAAEVAASRANLDPNLAHAPNYGLIDGYPAVVYINGNFHGIYTVNIPKDDWQFGMEGGEESREAILMASTWNEYCSLSAPLGDDTLNNYGLTVEHCSTLDDSWIKPSFNRLIELLNSGDPERIRAELPTHLDIEAAIDNFILVFTMNAADNVSKNTLWVTYDGVKWIPSMYDMDATFGMWWEGTPLGINGKPYTYPRVLEDGSYKIDSNSSKIYYILLDLYAEELEARWRELRASILTADHIQALFDEFAAGIPSEAFAQEDKRWKSIPYASANRSNMYEATVKQFSYLDEFFNNFNKEQA